MLAVALVAIMVMTLSWWARYSGNADLETLIDVDFTPEEINNAAAALVGHGVEYKIVGNRIMVQADKRFEALAFLGYDQILPHDIASGMDDLISHSGSLMDSPAQQEDERVRGRSLMLGKVIGRFPGVKTAVVVADPTIKRDFGDASVLPSASVYLEMKRNVKADRRLVIAAADMVTGSFAGMRRSRVHVAVDGVGFKLSDDDDTAGGGSADDDKFLELVKKDESYYAQKIRDQFHYMGDIAVAVTVRPDNRIRSGEKTQYNPKNSVQQETSVKNTTEETSSNTTAMAREPGASSNIGADVSKSGGSTGGSPDTTSKETNENTFENHVATAEERYQERYAAADVLSATVRVPRSFFVRLWKTSNPKATGDPDESMVEQIFTQQLPDLIKDVKGCTNIPTENAITVAMYPDEAPVVNAMPAASASVGLMLGSHVKEIALGALAVISLLMVSMMVKKSAPLPALAAAASTAGASASPLDPRGTDRKSTLAVIGKADEDLAGEVAEGAGALDGIELDAESVREQQVREQVTSMVTDNPDAAATILKRWLSRA
jgi:flagellar biosynthesis/type III secretory pathway M-ring protein FliF/YscJ